MNNNGQPHPDPPRMVHRDYDVALAPMGSVDLMNLLGKGWEPISALMGPVQTVGGEQTVHPLIVLRKKNSPVHLA